MATVFGSVSSRERRSSPKVKSARVKDPEPGVDLLGPRRLHERAAPDRVEQREEGPANRIARRRVADAIEHPVDERRHAQEVAGPDGGEGVPGGGEERLARRGVVRPVTGERGEGLGRGGLVHRGNLVVSAGRAVGAPAPSYRTSSANAAETRP
jgi:hypothetical protein